MEMSKHKLGYGETLSATERHFSSVRMRARRSYG